MRFEDCIKKRLVIRKSVDKETAMSLKKLAEIRLEDIGNISKTTLKIEAYYEVIKELITALMSLEGYKSYSHECLIAFLENNFSKFTNLEIELIDQLRITRNDISYRGIFVEDDYLIRNETKIQEIISKLRSLLEEKLK